MKIADECVLIQVESSDIVDGKFDIPANVLYIDIGAFENCEGLTNIVIPKHITFIPANAFLDCAQLSYVEIQNENTYIGACAFSGCKNLKTLKLPEKMEYIEDFLFAGCSSLEHIEIPNSVHGSIGMSAFEGCNSLQSIKFSSQIDAIDWSAFKGCSELKNVELPNTVKKIGDCAFEGCSSLESIKIPPEVNSIGQNVFKDCDNLATIEIADNGKLTEFDDRVTYYNLLDEISAEEQSVLDEINATFGQDYYQQTYRQILEQAKNDGYIREDYYNKEIVAEHKDKELREYITYELIGMRREESTVSDDLTETVKYVMCCIKGDKKYELELYETCDAYGDIKGNIDIHEVEEFGAITDVPKRNFEFQLIIDEESSYECDAFSFIEQDIPALEQDAYYSIVADAGVFVREDFFQKAITFDSERNGETEVKSDTTEEKNSEMKRKHELIEKIKAEQEESVRLDEELETANDKKVGKDF